MRIQETLAGNQSIKRPVSGRYLLMESAQGEICVSARGMDGVFLSAGKTYDLGTQLNSQELIIKNNSSGANSFILDINDNKLEKPNQTDLAVDVSAGIENGNDNQHLPAITIDSGQSAIVATANSSRKYLRVALASDAVGYVTLGKTGVNASGGGLLEPGMVDYMETEGALRVYNPQTSSVVVWVMEINRL